jgi:predicted nucleic acid-binding Zn ribbon protein
MSAPTLTATDALDLAALKATPQIGTNVLLSCGDGFYVTGVRETGEYGRCGECGEFVTTIQAFPVLDI